MGVPFVSSAQLRCPAASRSWLRSVLVAVFTLVITATPAQFFAQTFPPPGLMNDFSNPVLAQPNTAMVIKPGVPADTPYSEQPVTADPSYSPPPTQAPGTFVNSNYEGPVGVTGIFNGNV